MDTLKYIKSTRKLQNDYNINKGENFKKKKRYRKVRLIRSFYLLMVELVF